MSNSRDALQLQGFSEFNVLQLIVSVHIFVKSTLFYSQSSKSQIRNVPSSGLRETTLSMKQVVPFMYKVLKNMCSTTHMLSRHDVIPEKPNSPSC